MQYYESAAEVRRDVESFLEGKGYEVDGDDIKNLIRQMCLGSQ